MLAVAALIVGACSSSPSAEPTATSVTDVTQQVPDDVETVVIGPDVSEDQLAEIDSMVAELTTEQKIGQLLMPTLYGTNFDEVTDGEAALNLLAHGYRTPREIYEAYSLGGIIYLENNIQSEDQVRSFSRGLQASAQNQDGIGLLIAIDQEGGEVNRISDGVTTFPSAKELAGDPERVTEASYITGQQLQRQGINLVLAPVADVVNENDSGFIGTRSYGSDPNFVAEMVQAAIGGLQRSGVAAAAKHWPGHGATLEDSHESLPVVDLDQAEWASRHRVPFEAAVESNVAVIMVGHLAMPGIDPTGKPSSTSRVLITELLKEGLSFNGVVITDALNMDAVEAIDEGQLLIESIQAGTDILLIPPSLSVASRALNQAVVDGTITQERLDDAVTRVLTLKQKLGLLPNSEDPAG